MSWQQVVLSDVATAKKGKKPKTLFDQPAEGRLPYIDIKAFEKSIIRQYAEAGDSSVVNSDQILVVWDGARSGLVGRGCSGALGSTLAALRVHGADLDYVFRFLQSKYDEINSRHKGTGIPHVDPEVFWKLELPLPPTIEEQRRIVARLDQVTARIDDVQMRLDTIPATLKRFRQSTLAAACSGRLTAEWRQQEGIDEEWEERILGQAGAVTGGITKNGKRIEFSMQVPYLRVANVYANRLELHDVRFIGVTPKELGRAKLQRGDILIVEGNGSIDQIGRVAMWDGSIDCCTHQNHLIKFRANDDVLPKYVLFWLMSPQGRGLLMAQATSSAGLHTLSITKVSGLCIAHPSVQEQTEIVRRVEALFKQADAIEARYKKARAFVEKLTPSVLAKAFRGELG